MNRKQNYGEHYRWGQENVKNRDSHVGSTFSKNCLSLQLKELRAVAQMRHWTPQGWQWQQLEAVFETWTADTWKSFKKVIFL